MKSKLKIITAFIIGILVSGVSVYKAAGKLYASSIDVDTSKMSELGETSNVNLALNYLYGKAASITDNSGPTIYPSGFKGVGAEIYMDPTDLTKKCDISDAVSTPGRKTGCMRWYVYNSTQDKYIAILDHNTTDTTSTVIWSSRTSQLTTDTSNWQKGTNYLTVRLITSEEVAYIVDNNTWHQSSPRINFYFDTGTSTRDNTIDAVGESRYGWLFDYTNVCTSYGCNIQGGPNGYWTDSNYDSSNAWYISSQGRLLTTIYTTPLIGIRPVIEIPKSILE